MFLAMDVVSDDAFDELCRGLCKAGRDDLTKIEETWRELIDGLDEETLDWLGAEAEHPAAYLASRVGT